MTIYYLKPKFQGLLRPISDWLATHGVTPNMVTGTALVMSIAEGIAIWRFPTAVWPLLLLPVILFARMALNAIDGMMAREHHMQTTFGKWLNEVSDIVSDLALYAPFLVFFIGLLPKALFFMFLCCIILSEAIGIRGYRYGTRRYDGPMGKSDRALWMSVYSLSIVLLTVSGTWIFSFCYSLALYVAVWITIGRRYEGVLANMNEKRNEMERRSA